MKNRMTCSLIAAGLALLTLPAIAGNKDETVDAKFNKIDADRDGKVSRAEFEAYDQQKFAKMDANADGQLSLNELSAEADLSNRDASEKLKALDTNGDGKIDAAEHKAGCEAKFTSIDTDGDGYVSQTEMMAGHKAKKSKN